MDIVGEMCTWGSDVVPPKTLNVRGNRGARNLGLKTEGVDIEKFRNCDFGVVGFQFSLRPREASFWFLQVGVCALNS